MTHLPSILALLALNPVETITVDRAQVQERNHFYDESGRLVFEQLVCWERSPCGEKERCFAWRLIKHPSMVPEYDWQRRIWVTTFVDGEVLRRIESPSFRESWTQADTGGDVELRDRENYPKEMRRGLTNSAARPR